VPVGSRRTSSHLRLSSFRNEQPSLLSPPFLPPFSSPFLPSFSPSPLLILPPLPNSLCILPRSGVDTPRHAPSSTTSWLTTLKSHVKIQPLPRPRIRNIENTRNTDNQSLSVHWCVIKYNLNETSALPMTAGAYAAVSPGACSL
jgi:hypothetical protein